MKLEKNRIHFLIMLFAVLSLLVHVPSDAFAADTWTDATTNAGNVILFGVSMSDASNGVTVGSLGTIAYTSDGGDNWTAATTTNVGGTHMNAVSMSDANNGVAVGNGGTIVYTSDGGDTWTAATTTNVGVNPMYGVSMSDANNGVAVGNSGNIVYTSDGGDTWTAATTTNVGAGTMNDVSMSDANNGVAVGNGGNIVYTSDGGDNWTAATTTNVGVNPMYGVSMSDANNGVAVGTAGTIVYTSDGGDNWTAATINLGITNMRGVSMSDANNGVAVGNGGTIVFTGSTSSSSSDSDDSNGADSEHLTRPTFGMSHETFLPFVTEGFSFNGMTFDITDNWHTDFPKQSVLIGENNTFSAKVYAPYDVRVQEFLFGIETIGDAHNAELGVEVYYDYQGNVEGAKIVQKTDVVDSDSFSGITFPSKCMPDDAEEKCITSSITIQFLESLQHDVMAIKAIDWRNRAHTTYLNEGFDISGDSLNPMKTEMIPGTAKYEGLITVTQNEKYSKYWTAEDGRTFERNDHGTFTLVNQPFEKFADSGFPTLRTHSEFSTLINYETKRAEYVVKSICDECLDESFDKIDDTFVSHNVRFDRTINFEEMKSQEMLAQEKLREILDLDYLEYTRGYAIQNWE